VWQFDPMCSDWKLKNGNKQEHCADTESKYQGRSFKRA
jgi:hypothetical protein